MRGGQHRLFSHCVIARRSNGGFFLHPSRTLWWEEGALMVVDQRRLPQEFVALRCTTPAQVAAAIREMAVRGAPAIGCAAAYGIALSAALHAAGGPAEQRAALERDAACLRATR